MFVLYVTKREDFFYNLESLEVSIKPSMTSMTVLVKTHAKKVFFSGRTTKVQVPPSPYTSWDHTYIARVSTFPKNFLMWTNEFWYDSFSMTLAIICTVSFCKIFLLGQICMYIHSMLTQLFLRLLLTLAVVIIYRKLKLKINPLNSSWRE